MTARVTNQALLDAVDSLRRKQDDMAEKVGDLKTAVAVVGDRVKNLTEAVNVPGQKLLAVRIAELELKADESAEAQREARDLKRQIRVATWASFILPIAVSVAVWIIFGQRGP